MEKYIGKWHLWRQYTINFLIQVIFQNTGVLELLTVEQYSTHLRQQSMLSIY